MDGNSSLPLYEIISFTLAFLCKISLACQKRDVFKIVKWYLLYIKVIHSNNVTQILDYSCYKKLSDTFFLPTGCLLSE